MSLRDFNSSSDDRPVILNTDPVGNAGGLGGFHTVNPEDREPNNIPKIVGGLVVALMLGGAGAYIYSVSGSAPKQQVVASNQQLPPAPAPQAAPPAPMPASDSNTAATPAAAPMPAADATPTPKSTPIRSASVSRTRTASSKPDTAAAQTDSTPAVRPQQQVPSSAEASTAQPANPEVAPQQPSAPQVDATAPAQDQQPAATPAPAAQPAPQPQQ